MKKYKISVIIPAYNAECTISNALNSVYAQNLDDLEVIVVDDGSTDDTISVLKPYQQKKNLCVIHQKNQGVSAARNTGIKAASGKYIFFLDSDDYIGYNLLSTLYEFAEQKNLELVACEYLHIGSVVKHHESNPYVEFVATTKRQIVNFFSEFDPKYVVAKLYLSKAIISNNVLFPIDMNLGEDLYFVYTLLKYINRVGKISNVYYYNMNVVSNSLSKCYVKNMEQDIELQYKLWESLCENYAGLKQQFNNRNMSYGYYLTSQYIANFFKKNCYLDVYEKYQTIKSFFNEHNTDYLVEDGNPNGLVEWLESVTIKTRCVALCMVLFWFKERIKQVKNFLINKH